MPELKTSLKINRFTKQIVIITILILSSIILIQNFNNVEVSAHNPLATPIEIFSMWNDTAPVIDGQINFNTTAPADEWNMAAVYNLYDDSQNIRGKLLLQNDNNYLYIGLDVFGHVTEDPLGEWGAAIYFDVNHNGIFDSFDHAITFSNSSSSEYYAFQQASPTTDTWLDLESTSPGSSLFTFDILMDNYFGKSYFTILSHRQFEFKIALSELNLEPDDIIGIMVESYNHKSTRSGSNTWPYFEATSSDTSYKTNPALWGDLRIGDEFAYSGYVLEDNFNIKEGAVGKNNGTFLTTADINGDGNQELVLTSNRSVSSDNKLMAIYDFIDGEIIQIWNSWDSAHYSSLYQITKVAAYDFDEDNLDELYLIGEGESQIYSLSDWDDTSGDFLSLKTNIFENYDPITDIAIGNALNDINDEVQIIVCDNLGYFAVIEYNSNNKKFEQFQMDWFYPPEIEGVLPYYIHDILIANMDYEFYNEILMLSEYDTDLTRLQIREMDNNPPDSITYEYDNPSNNHPYWSGWEDTLLPESHANTEDTLGHTITVGDVDNDGHPETIIVGKNYLRIFGAFEFNETTIPLELDLSDSTNPSALAGGAAIIDLDVDGYNELIFGCANGTIIVYELSDSNPILEYNDFTVTEEWRGDFGTSPGTGNSIIGLDIDEDGVEEAIIGDNFGQILVLGLGQDPDVFFTSPSYGSTSNKEQILVEWDFSNESLPIVNCEIYINGLLIQRTGGSQTSAIIQLQEGPNDIEILALDISAKFAYDYLYVEYITSAPEVEIYDPPTSNYLIDEISVLVQYYASDPLGLDLTFEIYRNGTSIGTTTAYNYIVPLPSDGKWNVTIVVKNTNDETSKDSIIIIRDTTAPIISITSPADGTAIGTSSIELKWTAYDETSFVYIYEIYRDGDFLGNTTTKSFDVALVSDKEYILEVFAYDILGHVSFDAITLTRDTGDPNIDLDVLSLPKNYDDEYVTSSSSVFISWYGEDNTGGSGIEEFELRINGATYNHYTPNIFNDTIILPEEGANEILIIAWDFANNHAFDYYFIALDTFNPTVNITSPEDNYLTSANTTTIKWDSSDNGSGIEYYELYIDSQLEITIYDPDYTSHVIDIPDTKSYTVTIRSYDFVGRSDEDTINIIHDPLAPTFYIEIPDDFNSFSPSTVIDLSWYIYNINPDSYEIFVDDIPTGPYAPNLNSTSLNVSDYIGFIPISSFPTVNITIAVVESGIFTFIDSRFVTIDQSIPQVSILEPSNFEQIFDDIMYLDWSGFDQGSGIAGYTIYANETYIAQVSASTTELYVDISQAVDGNYTILVSAFDLAGNNDNASIQVELHPSPPGFHTNLPTSFITNDPNFPIEITIDDPGYGVKIIQVIVDNSILAFSIDYNETIQYDPFILSVDIFEEDFIIGIDEHNITVIVYDQVSRWSDVFVDLLIDKIDPTIFGNPIIGESLLGASSSLALTENYNDNIIDLSLTTRDVNGISTVTLTISNSTYSIEYDMLLNENESVGDLYVFEHTVNFNLFSADLYSIDFEVTDIADNSYIGTYSLNITKSTSTSTPPPGGQSNWLMDNLYTIVLPSAGGLLLVILLSILISVSARKRRVNLKWQDALEAVAYVTKTGLTTAFVPYSKEFFNDEQLFGGALTGIVGILGEITGETATEMKVQVMEYGGKQLMICPGIFGNSILLVNSVKPILKEKLMKFTMEFELTYKFSLSSELVDLNEFEAVPTMVESYFGIRKVAFQEPIEEYETFEELNQNDQFDY